MRLRAVFCVLAACTVAGVLAFGAVGVGASSGSAAGEQLLAGMRPAVADHDFNGVMVVEWHDAAGRLQQKTVPVRSDDGGLRVQGMATSVGPGPSEIVHGDRHALVMWSVAENAARPAPSAKYALTVDDGPRIAGRSTRVVEARKRGAKQLSARYYLDTDTGLLLRRQEFGPKGKFVRSVSFKSISDQVPATAPKPTAPSSGAYVGRAIKSVEKPFRAPARTGNGYALVGRYQLPSGTVQLFYSDGLYGASIFQQKGRLAWSGLPSGGTDTKVAGRSARQYVIPGGEALVWEARGVVYTCVTDAPPADLTAMVKSFPSDDGSGWGDAVDVVLAPFSW